MTRTCSRPSPMIVYIPRADGMRDVSDQELHTSAALARAPTCPGKSAASTAVVACPGQKRHRPDLLDPPTRGAGACVWERLRSGSPRTTSGGAKKFDGPTTTRGVMGDTTERASAGRRTAIRPRAGSGDGARRPAGAPSPARALAAGRRVAGDRCFRALDGDVPCCSRRGRRAAVGGDGPRSE